MQEQGEESPSGQQAPTCHTVLGHQGRAQRAEGVKGFPQQPLLSIASHLPVAGTHVVCHSEASHMGHGICSLWGQGVWPDGRLAHGDTKPGHKGSQSLNPMLGLQIAEVVVGEGQGHVRDG